MTMTVLDRAVLAGDAGQVTGKMMPSFSATRSSGAVS
jgi:hypothetical protein